MITYDPPEHQEVNVGDRIEGIGTVMYPDDLKVTEPPHRLAVEGNRGGRPITVTDDLRRLLDECGVEYRTHGTTDRTWFEVGNISWFIIERENGSLTADAVFLTPEQAIAATLGRGTCQLKRADWDDGTCTWGCICSACDAHLEHETGIGYNYCPICGAKVVDE